MLSVLIAAYNGAPWLAETLSRLPAAAGGVPFEAVVVDNASTDETVLLCKKTPGVQVLCNARNLGFSRAVNQAAAAAKGDILVVINQDLHLEPGSLKQVHDFLSSSSNNAVVGGALSFPDGSEQPSCGPFPTLIGTLARLMLPRKIRKYRLARPHSKQAQAVDWVTGAFVAFRRELFLKISGFDEDYFMYYEDVDLCLRALHAGFKSYFLPSARAVHLSPYSTRRGAPAWLRREVRLSQMTFFRKHRPSWESAVLRFLNRAYFLANGLAWR